MMYQSTRDSRVRVSASQAIVNGISADGGLYVPERLGRLDKERLSRLSKLDYRARAVDILGELLDDFTEQELRDCVDAAYGQSFDDEMITPISRLGERVYMLELWHGPTCAFKDLALQLLPRLLTVSAGKCARGKEIDILVATSGDTGKAALEGFRDVPGTRIIVFYPDEGVSEIQKLQMLTQEGENVAVVGVRGNFDDTQTAVKRIFADPALSQSLLNKNAMLSSANSINWGRLAPQIVYYVGAYCELLAQGELEPGETVNIAVPTGNFGNILAAWYAGEMGLPIKRLICASNANKVLADFIETGVYDRRRDFFMTASPSMDILVSSNLERLLYALSGLDDEAVASMMRELAEKGAYSVPGAVHSKLRERFWGGFCDDENTFATIRDTFREYSYLCDTHTAVALRVHADYVRETGDAAKTIVAGTASPYKFADGILSALTGTAPAADGFEQLHKLAQLTGTKPPAQILELSGKPVRFSKVCGSNEMPGVVREILGV